MVEFTSVMPPLWCMKWTPSAVVDMLRLGAATTLARRPTHSPSQKSQRRPMPPLLSSVTSSSKKVPLTASP